MAEQILLTIRTVVTGRSQVDDLANSTNRLNGIYRDADGRLRDLRGRFAAAGQAAQGAGGQIQGAGSAASGASGQFGKLNLSLMNLQAGLAIVQQVTQSVQAMVHQMKEWSDAANKASTDTKVFELTLRRFAVNTDEAGAVAERLAKKFGLSVQDVQGSMTTLIRVGFRDMGQLEKVMEGAAASAIAFGRDASAGFERVADAAATGLSMPLNSIGIAQNISQYNQMLAKSLGKTADALTETEKAQALYNLVVAATGTEVEALGEIQNDYVRSQQEAALAQKQFARNMGELTMPTVIKFNRAMAGVTGVMAEVAGALRSGKDPLDAIALRFPQLASVLVRLRPILDAVKAGFAEFSQAGQQQLNKLQPVIERLRPSFEAAGKAIGPMLTRLGGVMKEMAANSQQAIDQIIIPLLEKIAPIIAQVIQRAAPLVVSLGEAFVEAGKLILAAWEHIVAPILEKMAPIVRDAVDQAARVLGPLIETVKKVFQAVRQAIEGDWSGAWDSAKKALGNTLLGVQRLLDGLADMVWKALLAAADLIDKKADELWGRFLNFGQSAAAQFVAGFKNIEAGIKDAIANALEGAISRVPPKLRDWLAGKGLDLNAPLEALRESAARDRGQAQGQRPQPTADNKPLPVSLSGDKQNEAFFRAIFGQETGGKGDTYGVVNPIGALGKYQVMAQHLLFDDREYSPSRNNLGWFNANRNTMGQAGHGWDYLALKKDITPEEYLKNPQYQELIAQYQMGANLQKQLNRANGNLEVAVKEAAKDWYGRGNPGKGWPTPDQYAASVWARFQSEAAKGGSGNAAAAAGSNGPRTFSEDRFTLRSAPNTPAIRVSSQVVAEEWGAAFIGSLKDVFVTDPGIDSDCAIIAARVMGRLGVHLEGSVNDRINAGKLVQQFIDHGGKKVGGEAQQAQAASGDLVHFQGPGFGAKGSGNHVGVVVGVTPDGKALVLANPGNGPTQLVSLDSVLEEQRKKGNTAAATIYRAPESPYAQGKAGAPSPADTQQTEAYTRATNALISRLEAAKTAFEKVKRGSSGYAEALKTYHAELSAVNTEAQKGFQGADSRGERDAYKGIALRAKGAIAGLNSDPLGPLNDRLEHTRTNLNLATEGTEKYTQAQKAYRAALLAVIDASVKHAGTLQADDPKRKALGDAVKAARAELKTLDDALKKGDGAAKYLREKQAEVMQGSVQTATKTAATAQRGYDEALKKAGESGEKQLAVVRQQGAALLAAQQEQVRKSYDLAVLKADQELHTAVEAANKLKGAEKAAALAAAQAKHDTAVEAARTAREDGLRSARAEQDARLEAAKKGALNDRQMVLALQAERNLALLKEDERLAQAQADESERVYSQQLKLAGDNKTKQLAVEKKYGAQVLTDRTHAAALTRQLAEKEADETYRLAQIAAQKLSGDAKKAYLANADTQKRIAYDAARDAEQVAVQAARDVRGDATRELQKDIEKQQRELRAKMGEERRRLTVQEATDEQARIKSLNAQQLALFKGSAEQRLALIKQQAQDEYKAAMNVATATKGQSQAKLDNDRTLPADVRARRQAEIDRAFAQASADAERTRNNASRQANRDLQRAQQDQLVLTQDHERRMTDLTVTQLQTRLTAATNARDAALKGQKNDLNAQLQIETEQGAQVLALQIELERRSRAQKAATARGDAARRKGENAITYANDPATLARENGRIDAELEGQLNVIRGTFDTNVEKLRADAVQRLQDLTESLNQEGEKFLQGRADLVKQVTDTTTALFKSGTDYASQAQGRSDAIVALSSAMREMLGVTGDQASLDQLSDIPKFLQDLAASGVDLGDIDYDGLRELSQLLDDMRSTDKRFLPVDEAKRFADQMERIGVSAADVAEILDPRRTRADDKVNNRDLFAEGQFALHDPSQDAERRMMDVLTQLDRQDLSQNPALKALAEKLRASLSAITENSLETAFQRGIQQLNFDLSDLERGKEAMDPEVYVKLRRDILSRIEDDQWAHDEARMRNEGKTNAEIEAARDAHTHKLFEIEDDAARQLADLALKRERDGQDAALKLQQTGLENRKKQGLVSELEYTQESGEQRLTALRQQYEREAYEARGNLNRQAQLWQQYQADRLGLEVDTAEQLRRIRLKIQRDTEDAVTRLSMQSLEQLHTLGRMSEEQYLNERADAQIAAAQRVRDRAIQDATSYQKVGGFTIARVDQNAVNAANSAYTSSELDATNERDAAVARLHLQNARSLLDAQAALEQAGLEERHAQGLLSERDYQQQREQAEVNAAYDRNARAVQDANGNADAIKAANLQLEADLTRIRVQGAQDRRDIAIREADAEIEQAKRRFEKTYGLDREAYLQSLKNKRGELDAQQLALGPNAAGSAAYEALALKLQEINDLIADVEGSAHVLDAYNGGLSQLQKDYEQGRITGAAYNEVLSTMRTTLLAEADAADKAGDPTKARKFRDQADAIALLGTNARAAVDGLEGLDTKISKAQRKVDKSFGLDGQDELVSALTTKVVNLNTVMQALKDGGVKEGSAVWEQWAAQLRDANDALDEAKGAPNLLATWQTHIDGLGKKFASGGMDAKEFTKQLGLEADKLLQLADAAEKAGDPKSAQGFRDMAASLRAMNPQIAAVLQKMGKVGEYIGYFKDLAGAFSKLTAAIGETEEEYDSITGEKLATPWKDLTANLDGAAKAAETLMSIATDVMKVIANPADIGAWVSLITKVVSSVADAIAGFQKAKAEVARLKQEFAADNPLLNPGDYQKVYTRSRGWLADTFGGGPQVVNEIDKIGLPVAQKIAGAITNGIGSGFDAYRESGKIEDFAKALNAEITKGLRDGLVQGFINDPERQKEYADAIKGYTDAWKTHDPAMIQAAAEAIYRQTQETTEKAKELAKQLDELDRINGTGRYSPEAIAARERDLAERRLGIEEQQLELLHTRGLVSTEEYEKQKLDLAIRRIRLEMAAALAAAGLTAEQIALIQQQYDLQIQQAQAAYDAQALERAKQQLKQLGDLRMNNAETALKLEQSLATAGLDTQTRIALASAETEEEKWQIQQAAAARRAKLEEQFERRRLSLTLARIKAEEDAELERLRVEGASEELLQATRDRFSLSREEAEQALALLIQRNQDEQTAASAEHAAQMRQQAEQTRQSWRQSLSAGVQALLEGNGPLQAMYDGVRSRTAQAIQDGFVVKRIVAQLDPLFEQLDRALSVGIDPDAIIRQIGAALPGLSVEMQTTLGPILSALNAAIPQLTSAVTGNTAALKEMQFTQTTVVQSGPSVRLDSPYRAMFARFS